MIKFNFFLLIGLLIGLIVSYKLAAKDIHNGIFTGIQGGMLNTIADEGKNPDTGTFGAHLAYFGAYKKTEEAKNYSYFKGGLDYESSFGPMTALQGFGVFADTGAVLFDMWRIGAGVTFNYLTKKDLMVGLLSGFVISPYLETAIMWQAFERSGFDFGFRIGSPVKVTAQRIEPYLSANKMQQIDWKFTASYYHFFGGKK